MICRTDSGLPLQSVIGRLQWDHRGGEVGVHVRKRAHSAVVTATNATETLRIHLFATDISLSDKGTPSSGLVRPPEADVLHTYTAAEVRDFVGTVGDANPIHRTACPIVPAYQLFRTLAARYAAATYDLRLRAPVHAGETVYIVRTAHRVEGYTDTAHVFTLTLSQERK